MKVDLEFVFFRLLVFFFLMTIILLTMYLLGTYQSFMDNTLVTLFSAFRFFAWLGLLMSIFSQVLLLSKKAVTVLRRVSNLLILGFFGCLYFLVEFLKAWIYPGTLP
ncbi:MAG: hypothetical protein WCG80_01675 [Spirochaetales bacterium]